MWATIATDIEFFKTVFCHSWDYFEDIPYRELEIKIVVYLSIHSFRYIFTFLHIVKILHIELIP